MLEQHEPLHAARFYRALGLVAAVRVHDMLTNIYATSKTCAPKAGQAIEAKPSLSKSHHSTMMSRSNRQTVGRAVGGKVGEEIGRASCRERV